MLAVVTVASLWLGYEVRWMRAREAFIADEQSARDNQAEWWSIAATDARGKATPQAPGMLALLGEQGYSTVSFLAEGPTMQQLTDLDRERLAEARRLFPEAKIRVVHVWDTPDEHGVGSWMPG
jgi:hypothetical protein